MLFLAGCAVEVPDLSGISLKGDPCDGTLYRDKCSSAGLWTDYAVYKTCKHPQVNGHLKYQGTYRCVAYEDVLCCPGP